MRFRLMRFCVVMTTVVAGACFLSFYAKKQYSQKEKNIFEKYAVPAPEIDEDVENKRQDNPSEPDDPEVESHEY